jgi:hypothetical protein
MKLFVAYFRVSTERQGRSGLISLASSLSPILIRRVAAKAGAIAEPPELEIRRRPRSPAADQQPCRGEVEVGDRSRRSAAAPEMASGTVIAAAHEQPDHGQQDHCSPA